MNRMNPLNLCEPLQLKVHRQKSHDVAAMTSENEPYEPFLDMVWGITKRGIALLKRRVFSRPGSSSRKVHRVHRYKIPPRSLAVWGYEPTPRDVHPGFIGFMPMIGGLASHREVISPVAVTSCSVFAGSHRSTHNDMTGQIHASMTTPAFSSVPSPRGCVRPCDKRRLRRE